MTFAIIRHSRRVCKRPETRYPALFIQCNEKLSVSTKPEIIFVRNPEKFSLADCAATPKKSGNFMKKDWYFPGEYGTIRNGSFPRVKSPGTASAKRFRDT
ncbi:MAG: hypothetical protein IJR48_02425 [Oscillibacter sp.]|nr:hypothetical protein [Oscillibacter sp.]